jgi:serine phosphatase RsbU (regulator of sigma subunit)/predicted ester cyclase
MSAEHNKALVRRFLEAHEGKADLDALHQMLAPDFISHIKRLPGQQPDREGYKWAIAQYSAAFSDRKFIVEEQVAEADTVVSRFTVRATHDSKEILGVAPTDREVSYKAIAIHHIVGGKITEEWTLATTGPRLLGQRLKQEERERERTEQELLVAQRIQQASLPKEVPQLQGWKISPYYRPAREVGGDFYDFHLLPEGRLGVVVGDATGKGVPAALVMSTTCGMLQLAAQALGSSSPGEVLREVNEALVARIPQNMFVTCFYAILEPKSATLSYANAGHDPPYLQRRGEAEELRARGMPLGLMPGMGYEEKEMVLDSGEAALFYTDGLVEAHSPKGEMFGFPRLRALIAEHAKEERPLGDFLMEELYTFVGEGWEQEDDVTLVTLRRSTSENGTSRRLGE